MSPDYENRPGHADYDPNLDAHKPKKQDPSELKTPAARFSGGELSPDLLAEYVKLRDLIQNEPDVHRVLGLARRVDGTWLYYIQTPFVTYPKYVIGECSADNSDVVPIFATGAQWSADARWDRLRHDVGMEVQP